MISNGKLVFVVFSLLNGREQAKPRCFFTYLETIQAINLENNVFWSLNYDMQSTSSYSLVTGFYY